MRIPLLRLAAACCRRLPWPPSRPWPRPRPPTPADKPAAKPVRSIPYVSITGDDGRQRHYETNAIPLLFNRACFGWRMYLGGPNRTVTLTEVLTTSQPAEQVIAGPETEVSADKTQGHHPHARGRAGRRAAALLVHHPGRSAGHLHLRHLDRRRAARRVRVLRHRGARPEPQHRSARPELPQQVQLGRARPSLSRARRRDGCVASASGRPLHPRWLGPSARSDGQRHPRCAHAQLRPPDRDLPAGPDRRLRDASSACPRARWAIPRSAT